MQLNAILTDPSFDDTEIDFDGTDCLTITQTDELGKTHQIVLSPAQVSQLSPIMELWCKQSLPLAPPALVDA